MYVFEIFLNERVTVLKLKLNLILKLFNIKKCIIHFNLGILKLIIN